MPDHRLGEQTLTALRRLRERDIALTFATGRHALEMHHVIGEFSLDAFLITGNGTRIHSLEGEELYRQDLNPEVAEEVLHSVWDTQASMHVFNDGGWFTGQGRNCSGLTPSAAFIINCAIRNGCRRITSPRSVSAAIMTICAVCGSS